MSNSNAKLTKSEEINCEESKSISKLTKSDEMNREEPNSNAKLNKSEEINREESKLIENGSTTGETVHTERTYGTTATRRWANTAFEHLPTWLQDNEFLLGHHRPELASVRRCLKSIFSIHSETGNIWTHLLGCIAFIVLATWFLCHPGSSIVIEEKIVFSFFFVGAIACLGMSCTFHTMNCHSHPVSKFFHKLDYVGISLLIIGSFIPILYYSFYCRLIPKISYIAMIVVLGILATIVTFWEKFSERAYRPWRAVIFVAMGLSAMIPMFHFLLINGFDTIFIWLLIMAFLYIFGACIYATRVPERFFPGKFDVWFQSHQLFHMCVVCAALVHYVGITNMAQLRLNNPC